MLFLYVVVVHSFDPVVLAVALKWMTIVPPGSMSLLLGDELMNCMNPAGGELITVQVRRIEPGSVAVTVTEVGVPAPDGIAT